jgi:nucleotide-binding universal stress UspA family protein
LYKKILVLVDDRLVSQSAITQAIDMAQTHHAELVFYYLLPRYSFTTFDMLAPVALTPEEFQSQANDQGQTLLNAASQLAERAGLQSSRAIGAASDDSKSVGDMATLRDCDLIVVGADGQNAVMRILSGSIIPGLITAATVPILICPNNEYDDRH